MMGWAGALIRRPTDGLPTSQVESHNAPKNAVLKRLASEAEKLAKAAIKTYNMQQVRGVWVFACSGRF